MTIAGHCNKFATFGLKCLLRQPTDTGTPAVGPASFVVSATELHRRLLQYSVYLYLMTGKFDHESRNGSSSGYAKGRITAISNRLDSSIAYIKCDLYRQTGEQTE